MDRGVCQRCTIFILFVTSDHRVKKISKPLDLWKILTTQRKIFCILNVCQSNFLPIVVSNPELLWLYFTTVCDWSRKLVLPSRLIKRKTKTIGKLITRVLYSLLVFNLRSHWPLVILPPFLFLALVWWHLIEVRYSRRRQLFLAILATGVFLKQYAEVDTERGEKIRIQPF